MAALRVRALRAPRVGLGWGRGWGVGRLERAELQERRDGGPAVRTLEGEGAARERVEHLLAAWQRERVAEHDGAAAGLAREHAHHCGRRLRRGAPGALERVGVLEHRALAEQHALDHGRRLETQLRRAGDET